VSLDNGDDGSLLDGRGSLETVGVDTSEELRLELHVVEADGRDEEGGREELALAEERLDRGDNGEVLLVDTEGREKQREGE
jgi:hypothetical protein